MLADCHVHITPYRGWSNLNTVTKAQHRFDTTGIDKVVLIPLSVRNVDEVRYCLDVAKKHPKKYKVVPQITKEKFGLIHGSEEYIAGFKIHPVLQEISPTAAGCIDIINIAEEMEKPIIFHTYLQSQILPLEEMSPFVFDKLGKTYKNVNFVLAHSCFPKLYDAYCLAKSNKNVYLDLSYFANVAAGTSLFADFCEMIAGIDKKVIFGSDFPEVEIDTYIGMWKFSLRKLPYDKQENIFFNNGCRVFGL